MRFRVHYIFILLYEFSARFALSNTKHADISAMRKIRTEIYHEIKWLLYAIRAKSHTA